MNEAEIMPDGSRTLTVTCDEGLGNRLMVLISGLAVARATARSFRMVWPRTSACSARFEELFTNAWNVREDALAGAPEPIWCRNYLGLPDLLEAGEAHVSIRSHLWLFQPRRFPGHERLEAEGRKLLAALQPRPEIERRMADFQREHFRSRMIGVHLRRGDLRRRLPDATGNTDEAIAAVEDLLHALPDAGILLCTDDGAPTPSRRATSHEGVREAFRKRFGGRVVWSEPRSLDRNDPAAIQDAVADLGLLRRTDAFVGTAQSTFSRLAGWGRDRPVILCESATARYRLLDRAGRLTGVYHLVGLANSLRARAPQPPGTASAGPSGPSLGAKAKGLLERRAPTLHRLLRVWGYQRVVPPSSVRPSGVIVYLVRSKEKDVRDLTKSLTLLRANFLDRFPHPVILFVEPDFRDEWRAAILRETGLACRFETVEFRLPDFIDPAGIPPHILLPKFDVGYRHMCRFFGGTIYRHPALREFQWYWRLDTDSWVLGPVRYDVFAFMEKRGLVYGYNCIDREHPVVAAGFWETTQQYLKARGIRPFFLHEFMRDGAWDRSMYYTNFEISRLDFWRSESFRDYFDFIDRSGGIYQHRWGDAIIHALAVAILVPRRKVHCFKDIHYGHQRFLNHSNPARRLARAVRLALSARVRRWQKRIQGRLP